MLHGQDKSVNCKQGDLVKGTRLVEVEPHAKN